jgi:hypothetical protein
LAKVVGMVDAAEAIAEADIMDLPAIQVFFGEVDGRSTA